MLHSTGRCSASCLGCSNNIHRPSGNRSGRRSHRGSSTRREGRRATAFEDGGYRWSQYSIKPGGYSDRRGLGSANKRDRLRARKTAGRKSRPKIVKNACPGAFVARHHFEIRRSVTLNALEFKSERRVSIFDGTPLPPKGPRFPAPGPFRASRPNPIAQNYHPNAPRSTAPRPARDPPAAPRTRSPVRREVHRAPPKFKLVYSQNNRAAENPKNPNSRRRPAARKSAYKQLRQSIPTLCLALPPRQDEAIPPGRRRPGRA
jgi:hypothetical protein